MYDWLIANLGSRGQGNEGAPKRTTSQPQALLRGFMARRNYPDVTFEVVRHGSRWAIWLVVIIGGTLGVFALTALIASLLI
jgi:hypothetical protein